MNIKNVEKDILNEAIEGLRNATGLIIEIDELNLMIPNQDYGYDAAINIKWEDMKFHFKVEIKQNVNMAVLGTAKHQMLLFQQKGILVTRYVAPQMADRMREMRIPFFDTAGNAYIDEPPLYIFVKGNRPAVAIQTEKPKRIFRPAGLQVIFALLCHPGLEKAPYREIAGKADVALGTVGWIMYDLRNQGYLVERANRERRLIRKDDLMKQWATAYPERLRPKMILGRYKTEIKEWWMHVDLKEFTALWGGEIAANRLTNYLKPQILTIYAKPPLGKFILRNRLEEDVDGDIEILKMFWDFPLDQAKNETVPALLVYADLLATGDERNIETARILYERELTGFIRED